MGALNELTRSVGKLEGNLEAITSQLEGMEAKLDSLGADVRKLSRTLIYSAGFLSGVVALAGFLLYLAADVFRDTIRDLITASSQRPAITAPPASTPPVSPPTTPSP